MAMKALIYTRVSQDRAAGRSTDEQERECRAACERMGYAVLEVITDSAGASRHSKGQRRGWQQVQQVLQAGEVDVLVTWASSRAQRSVDEYTELRRLCVEHGVLWHYNGNTYNLDNVDDRFKTALDASIAEKEAGETSRNVLRAVRANAVAGRPHGRKLFGYQRVYDPGTGRLLGQVPDALQAPIVARVFSEYVSGRGPRTIADGLERDGVSTMTGKGAWTDEHVRRMLRNQAYIARRVHKDEVLPAQWDPIIDDATWATAQARLVASRLAHPRVRGTDRLLSGVGRCGVCGAKIAVGHDRNKRKTGVNNCGWVSLGKRARTDPRN